jgi:hypothetical protein
MRAILASHRFNPGHLSHLLANENLLREAGYDVRFRWPPAYARLGGATCNQPRASLFDLIQLESDSLYVLWFPSIAGLLDVVCARAVSNAKVVYVFHEPFTSYHSYRQSGFPALKVAKVYFVHLVSSAIARLSHAIVFPSRNALRAFEHRYSSTARVAVLPLMFDDEAAHVPEKAERSYVSYIGTVAEDHAFDEFVSFVDAAIRGGHLPEFRFLIATRSVLPGWVLERLGPHVTVGRVVVQSGRPLSNGEINDAFGQSFVVWNAYKRSMQSGVLPKAYMFGTPILVCESNRSDFFVDGEHGVEVSARYETGELAAAVLRIWENFDWYSRACRRAFFRLFHYRASAAAFLSAIR